VPSRSRSKYSFTFMRCFTVLPTANDMLSSCGWTFLASPSLTIGISLFHWLNSGSGLWICICFDPLNRIAKTKRDGFGYDPQTERVYINPNQYFAPVPLEVWVYRIGGYQVCEKWLKDRRGRGLGLDEIQSYCRIVTALARTIEIQEEIDALYSRVEERLLMLEIQ